GHFGRKELPGHFGRKPPGLLGENTLVIIVRKMRGVFPDGSRRGGFAAGCRWLSGQIICDGIGPGRTRRIVF
ncbi:MAG: hypothetical protein MN733_14315, partial [Nitrososphaera sp.]|nr:hypothetical protein [Nitrososphaera sp.]